MSISWDEQDKLTTSDAAAGFQFGKWVVMDGNYAVSASKKQLYVFKKDDNAETWSEQQKIIPTYGESINETNIHQHSFAISNNYIIRGQPFRNSKEGGTYIFKKDENSETWTQTQLLLAGDKYDDDLFGRGVDIDGNYAIIGAPQSYLTNRMK